MTMLHKALEDAKRNERHNTVAETHYWLNQYKMIAEQALAAPVQEPVAFNAGVPPLYPEMKDGETISVEYITPPAAPVQEPVAKVDANDEGYWADILPDRTVKVGQFLYAATQRQWVGLSEDEIAVLMMESWGCASIAPRSAPNFARAIEAKLKEKNT